MTTTTETTIVEEAPTAATGIDHPRLAEEIMTATNPLLHPLKRPRRSLPKQTPRSRQPGHPRRLLLVARR